MNNYIYEYYQTIKDGTTLAGRFILQWYERIIEGLENRSFFYSAKKAQAAIVYIENFCRHHEGVLAPNLIKLELWQKAFLSVMYGITNADGLRWFREIVLIIGRKNGKTLLAAAISSYEAFCGGEYGGLVVFAAPKFDQSRLCYNAFYQMTQNEPRCNKLVKKRRTDIYIESTNTTIKPLAFSAKTSDGLNVSLCIADEIASWQGDRGLKFYEVIKSSMGSRRAPCVLSISTAGYVEGGVYDELIKRCTAVIKGTSEESRLAPFLYMIDDPRKWDDLNELRKSNPNLGVSVGVDYMLEEIAVARGSISKKQEFLTKYCNVKQSSSQAWLNAIDIQKTCGEPLKLEDFTNSYAVCGVDLSRSVDLTAAVCVIERAGTLNVFAKFFMPTERLETATAEDGIPYAAYVERGFLQLSGENVIDYNDAFTWLTDLIKKYKIYPLQTGYDRYNAQYFTQQLQGAGFHVDDVYQGFNLTPVINEFEGLIKDGKINIGDNDLLKIHLLNAATKIEAGTERRKLEKITKRGHIDGVAALLDAMTVRQKWFAQIGRQLKNER